MKCACMYVDILKKKKNKRFNHPNNEIKKQLEEIKGKIKEDEREKKEEERLYRLINRIK